MFKQKYYIRTKIHPLIITASSYISHGHFNFQQEGSWFYPEIWRGTLMCGVCVPHPHVTMFL